MFNVSTLYKQSIKLLPSKAVVEVYQKFMGLEPVSILSHFQKWISLSPACQSESNSIWSTIGVGDWLQKVLGQIGSELWFPWQHIAPVGLLWGKSCEHSSSFIFYLVFFILACSKVNHYICNWFEIRQDPTRDCGAGCPWSSGKIPIYL